MTANLGAFAFDRIAGAGDPFESFDPKWGSRRTHPEVAYAWTRVPSLVQVELRQAFSERAYAHFRMGLRRDFAAWREDDLGSNLPLSTREVDLNEPSLGYLSWRGDWLELAVGRFPTHWSPTPDFGLTLTHAVPYHNGAQAVLKAARVRYRFLVSSLNPWLEGTPSGPASSEDYPVGSEEWRQRNYPVLPGSQNAHRRVYDDRSKTLIAHRLETWMDPLTLGVTETNVVGGKIPDFRDANPFAIFHNDFHEGYSNNNVSVDALLQIPFGFSLAAEIFMDDVAWSETEGDGGDPSLLGYLAAVRHAASLGRWSLIQSLHAIRTDPYLYGFLQPLNTYASRHVLTSNYEQAGDSILVDKYVVDYPIGYLRGADAFDFWYRARAAPGNALRLEFSAALLSLGQAGAAAPFERSYTPHGSSPSGVAERELRLTLKGAVRPRRDFELGAACGWGRTWNLDHVAGRDKQTPRFMATIAWVP